MFTIVGLLVVLGSVLGGFAMSGGTFAILLQPNELVVIGGAALGGLIISTPGTIRGRVLHALRQAFTGRLLGKDDYLEILRLQYEVYCHIRQHGPLGLDEDVNEIQKSPLFRKYPGFLKNDAAVDFYRDGLKQVVNGTASVDELDLLLETELETHQEEAALPVGLLRTTSDSLPGLGIVAAVLGIIVTMGHLDQPPEMIGHHVAAALVGTFLGILLCYGALGPIATSIEMQDMANARYLHCLKEGLMASVRGAAPSVAVEFARKAVYSGDRPSSDEVDAACRKLKAAVMAEVAA